MAQAKADIQCYEQAETFLANRDARKVAANTDIVRRDSETIAVRLYATDIVTFHSDGRVTFDTGGYDTTTTRQRMNQFSPDWLRVYSKEFENYVYDRRAPCDLGFDRAITI